MLSSLLASCRVLGQITRFRLVMASILPPIDLGSSGVALRRSSRLSRIEHVKSTSTVLRTVQRREIAISVNVNNTDISIPTVGGDTSSERTEEEYRPLRGEKRPKPRKRVKKSKEVQGDEDGGEAGPPKKRRKRQLKPEPEYIISDVERKETTFKGRLGMSNDICDHVYDSRIFDRLCLFEYSTPQQEAC